jgi:Kef-type K+ transport system membrane component KefB
VLLGWGIVPAIFLGGVTYISSPGVIARTLDDLGWMGNRETPLILAILVIEDLVMAGFLPFAKPCCSSAGAPGESSYRSSWRRSSSSRS